MRRSARIAAILGCLGFAILPFIAAGCGDSPKVAPIVESEEAKAANVNGQKAMEDYMKTKKSGAPSKTATPR